MCASPYWKDIIAEDCPTACGFCETPIGNCTDMATGCNKDLSICVNIYMQDFVKDPLLIAEMTQSKHAHAHSLVVDSELFE
ncbi:hypothetical protein ANCDUO_12922 [Ancylostoma duodenale]|uniref:ShKT domain-containing protein n=1 Tax=Ancylostoma duodenale TaxID=51022 RepID=A0A0C2GDH1_9BILA|nr:hypothetical protein ANCDUO_12922 [Ancylostoma duodenale]